MTGVQTCALPIYSKCLSACIKRAKTEEVEALSSYAEETKRKQHFNDGSAYLNLAGGIIGGALTAASGFNAVLKPLGEFVPQATSTVSKVVQGREVIIDGARQAVLSGSLPSAKGQEDLCQKARETQASLVQTILQARANAMRA